MAKLVAETTATALDLRGYEKIINKINGVTAATNLSPQKVMRRS
ncbi:MAG: hypothetical protein V4582_00930 [Pseudomonadota bacterium]